MKKDGSNFNIIQPCIKQLPNDVNIGMCMDKTNNSVYSFLSFPKSRMSDDLIEERIQKLSKYKTKILNAIIGYFTIDDVSYLLQEQSNVFSFVSDFWESISESINVEGMEVYRDLSMQYIYALAYILNFFDEINIGAAKSGIELASFHDQFVPCFTGLGFPEIFDENKSSETNSNYFTDFCKIINPSLEEIPSYKEIANGKDVMIPGSEQKRLEILDLCKPIVEEENNDDNSEDEINNTEDESENNTTEDDNENNITEDDFNSEYKKTNFSVFNECYKQLPNDVKIGICMEATKKTGISFLSFPKKRFSERMIDDRIKKLNNFHSKVLNKIIGFFYKDKRCYLIQEQNSLSFIADIWSNIKDNLFENPGMEMYVNVAMQFVYSLAYILKFFDEIGIGAAKNAFELATFHDLYEVCFIGLGFPEIFGENKKAEDNPKYFEKFCKSIYPKMDNIPSYNELIESKNKLNGSKEKLEEILFICTGEHIEVPEDQFGKYEYNHINVFSECEKEFSNDVKIGHANDNKNYKTLCFISCPEERISADVINERIDALSKYHTQVLNAVIGYTYKKGRCYLILEQDNIFGYISDFWTYESSIYQKQNKDMLSHAMQYIYALAYILKFFDEIGIGAAKNAFELASYHDDYEICFIGLGFPEIFGENKKVEDNQKYFEDFCRRLNSKMKIIPSYYDLTDRKIRLLGSDEKLADILFICTGEHIEVPKLASKQCEEEEDFEYDDSDYYARKNYKYNIVDRNESILTDPCFEKPFYHDEESHIYNILPFLNIDEYINNGSIEFFGTSDIINSLGSEFQVGNIQNINCISHKTPNNPISIANEKLIITNVNNLVIPFCMKQSENQFIYLQEGVPLSESDFKIEYIGYFISFLYDLHEKGFLYLRNNTDNIFIDSDMTICGFDTCMKIGSKDCTSEMFDWDDEPTEATDFICLGILIYYLLTKEKLFDEDPETNKKKFKNGVKISSKKIGTTKAKMIRKLLHPDPNVRKSSDFLDVINSLELNQFDYFFDYLYQFYLNDNEHDFRMKNFKINSFSNSIFFTSYNTPFSGNTRPGQINLGIGFKSFSTSFLLEKEKFNLTIESATKAYISYDRKIFGFIVFLPCGETKLQWDDENGIIIKFPNFAVKMQQDGSLIYPDGNFRKRMEDGNLILEGEGMTFTHKGMFLEFKTDLFSFKMIDEEKFEIKSPLFLAKYSPDEMFFKSGNTWIRNNGSCVEIGHNNIHVVWTDEYIQLKYSFMEFLTKFNEGSRYRFFNKEYIPNDTKKSKYEIESIDIPLIEMPQVPSQARNKNKNLTTAEERSIGIKDEDIITNREEFDEYYEKLKSNVQVSKYFVFDDDVELPEIEEPKPKKKSKKNKKEKPKSNQNNDNDNENNTNENHENVQLPLLENTSNQALISQEELPQNFEASQAISKIKKNLLEGGENIAYFVTARIINFLKPKRKRKIVITSSGRIFLTNIGGDGILGNILVNKKSTVDINGSHIKVHASNKTFHFVFESCKDSFKFAEKVEQCIKL